MPHAIMAKCPPFMQCTESRRFTYDNKQYIYLVNIPSNLTMWFAPSVSFGGAGLEYRLYAFSAQNHPQQTYARCHVLASLAVCNVCPSTPPANSRAQRLHQQCA